MRPSRTNSRPKRLSDVLAEAPQSRAETPASPPSCPPPRITRLPWPAWALAFCLLGVIQCRDAAVDQRVGLALQIRPTDDRPDERLAQHDPMTFLERCRESCQQRLHDYTCLFNKQERIDGQLRPAEQTRISFRQEPFSVRMTWLDNPGLVCDACYVAGRWHDDDGQELALFKPAGALSLLAPEVRRPVRGKEALSQSRRTLDQFGFLSTLDLILEYARRAEGHADASLRYAGTGDINDRPTLVFERRLPFTGVGGEWPDRLLIVHIDREWLLPVACMAFADDDHQVLLGSYIFSEVALNPGVSDSVFEGVTVAQGGAAAGDQTQASR